MWSVAGISTGKNLDFSPANFCQDWPFYALSLVVAVHFWGNLIRRDFRSDSSVSVKHVAI